MKCFLTAHRLHRPPTMSTSTLHTCMIYYDHSLAVVGTSFFYLLQKKVIVALAVCFNMTAFRSKGRSHLSTLCIERVNVGGGESWHVGNDDSHSPFMALSP